MKRALLILWMLLPLASCFEDEEGFNGRFAGTQQFGIGQVDSPITVVLERNGNTISGSVTPPFQSTAVAFQNGSLQGSSIRFDRKEGDITYRYDAVLTADGKSLQGYFQPLGCLDPASGEPCQTDSNGSFNAQRR